MIVLDLEFNSGMYGERLEEVLQIGAVRCERLGGPIKDTFNVFIKPRVHRRLSPGAKVLPELRSSIDSQVSFKEAIAAFTEWCGDETEFAEWGRDDFKILGRNGVYWGVDVRLPERYYDIQSAFSKTLWQSNGFQLYTAAEYCGIPDSFVFHNALNDAVYTCLVGGYIRADALAESVCEITERDLHPVLKPRTPKKTQTRMGPFETRDAALNNLGSRRAICPKCRELFRVQEWYSAGNGTYYSQFSCREHGNFIRRLQLLRQPDGRYWTYNDTLTPSAENLKKLDEAEKSDRFPGRRASRRTRHRGRKK